MAKALELLKANLEPPKHELNDLDWTVMPSWKAITATLDWLTREPLLLHLLQAFELRQDKSGF